MRRSVIGGVLVLLSLTLAAPAWAAIVLDQATAEDFCDNCGSATNDVSFGTLPAVGSFVVGCIAGVDFSGTDIDFISGVADNQGNGAYTLIKKAPVAGGSGTAAIFYKENVASSGTFTLTFTASNTTLLGYTWKALSFTGVATASPADVNQTGGALGAVTSLSITTGSTNQADELVVTCGAFKSDGTDADLNIVQNTAGYTNFTIEEDTTVRPAMSGDYKVVAAIGAQTTDWSFDTTGASGSTAGVIATFKAAGACAGRLMLLGVGGC